MGSFCYDEGGIHLRYDAARGLPAETIALWLETLSRHLAGKRVETIVDVGCGTGRFAGALARKFGARVCGVDPSGKMLEAARSNGDDPRVTFLEAPAEKLPLEDASADLIFLSMVYHHLRDKSAALSEFRRVLGAGGRVAIRTALREFLDGYAWLRFFPAARDIEQRRTPSAEELTTAFREHGFRLVASETLEQLFAADAREYCGKIAMRGLSSLQAIPDAEFERGVADLRAYCEAGNEAADKPVYEKTALFVFAP